MDGMDADVSSGTALTVNGERTRVAAANLAALVGSLGHDAASVATAVNGTFVPRSARDTYRLSDGDAVEIVAPRQGG
jgi:sulfur carrier protein